MKTNFLLRVSACLLLASIADPCMAQSEESCERGCCCEHDPTPAGVMISHVHRKGEWMISYRFMRSNMYGLLAGTTPQPTSGVLNSYNAAADLMHMNMHMLMAMYGVNNRLTVMGMLGYNAMYMQMSMTSGKNVHHHPMSSAGFADSRLYALYSLTRSQWYQLLVSVGAGIPTGSISRKGPAAGVMYPGLRYPYDMQTGSGTLDILPGLTYLAQRGNLTWSGQAASVIRTGYNYLGYKLGNEITLNAWGAWQWLSFLSSSLRVEATCMGPVMGRDAALDLYGQTSSNPANYGGTRASVFAGTSAYLNRGRLQHRLSFEYGLPAYQDLNGIQLKNTSAINASWSIKF